ncbi:MAG: DUF2627 family protein [Hydrogenibacillus sp.]|nr:DUF2627 family protein [Hydrogenibacillus sp.]
MDRTDVILRRTLALIVLAAVGLVAAVGVDWMKDAFFSAISGIGFSWARAVLGLLFFLFGLAFLGGFIFYRDAKKSYLQPRFLKWYRRRFKKRRKGAAG